MIKEVFICHLKAKVNTFSSQNYFFFSFFFTYRQQAPSAAMLRIANKRKGIATTANQNPTIGTHTSADV
jgi:hypothetical protein